MGYKVQADWRCAVDNRDQPAMDAFHFRHGEFYAGGRVEAIIATI